MVCANLLSTEVYKVFKFVTECENMHLLKDACLNMISGGHNRVRFAISRLLRTRVRTRVIAEFLSPTKR